MVRIVSCVLLLALVLSGCYSVRISATDGDYRMTPPKNGKVIGKFDERAKANHFINGITKARVNISHVLGDAKIKKAANVEVCVKRSFGDIFLALLTASIYTPQTVQITGDIVEK